MNFDENDPKYYQRHLSSGRELTRFSLSFLFSQDREFVELENPFNGQPQSMQRSTGSRSTSPTGQGSLLSPGKDARNKAGAAGRSASSPSSPQQQLTHSAMCPCCSCWTCLPLHQQRSSTGAAPVATVGSNVAHLAVS